MEHCLNQLSEYIDGALDRSRIAAVEQHLSACAECRAVAEELRTVSKMVAGLPQQPLPIGFMQRLERKRAEAEAPRPAAAWGFSPRMAAFGLASVAVTLFVYDRSRPAAVPAVSGFMDSGISSMGGLGAASSEQDFKGAANARAGAKLDKGLSPAALSFDGSAGVVTGAASVAPAAEPVSEEQLQAALDMAPQHRSKKFARARGEPIAHLAGGGGAGGALEYNQPARMSSLAAVRGAAQAKPEKEISNEEIQQVLQRDRERMGIRKIVSPAGRRAKTLDELAKAAAAEGDDAPMLLSKAAPALPGSTVGTLKSPEELAAAKAEAAYERKVSAQKAKLQPAVEGAIAQSENGAFELWRTYSLEGRPPALDWKKQQLVVIVAKDQLILAQIVELVPSSAEIVVRYRESTRKGGMKAPSFDARPAPRTERPVRFERVD